ncbi:hypothetical protein [Conexibacter sp. CPCC 206217]|uniref:hypothetical protein n=1 Tax=Conexibacter sp. CPCC 206217 TaxID=3064574 RepID=UPI00271B184B|nr:hypothetical protein [Conexibacter sp. CPCC 206217]MDO8209810.1 hypothetical protein [Conexibacter sp. CPCC 206217]
MTASPRAAADLRRSGAIALALALLLAIVPAAAHAAAAERSPSPAARAAADTARFTGQVTDALRMPVHKLAAAADGRALADLVFVDGEATGTGYRTCVRRLGRSPLRTCFNATSGPQDSPTVTPLRFQRGTYEVRWRVAGETVARWRFRVV